MIPRDDLYRFDNHYYAFCRLGDNHRARVLIQRTCVTLPNQFADALDRFIVVKYDGLSLDLHSSQLVISLASFDETCKARVTLQIDGLLRPGIRPESYLIVEKHKPHGYQVGIAVVIDGSNL